MANNKGLFFRVATEEGEVTEPTTLPEGTLVEEVPAEVEADVADLNEAAGKNEDFVESIEDALNEVENLEDVQEVVEDSLEPEVPEGATEAPEGATGEGLDETAAKMAEIAVESICNRLNLPMRGKLVASMEDFGGVKSKVEATKQLAGKVGAYVKQVWEMIKKAVGMAVQKVKEFVTRCLDSNARLEHAAKQMLESINKAAYKDAPDAELADSKVAAAFSLGGKADKSTVDQLLKNTIIVVDAAHGILNVGKTIAEAVKNAATDGGKGVEAIKAAGEHGDKLLSNFEVKVEGEVTKAISPALVGGKQVVMTTDMGAFTMNVELVSVEGFKAAEKADVLKVADMKAVVQQVLAVTASVAKLKTLVAEVGTFQKMIDSAAAEGLKQAEKANVEVDKEALKLGQKMISAASVGVTKYTNLAPNMAVNAGKQALNYVGASIKAHTKDQAAPGKQAALPAPAAA